MRQTKVIVYGSDSFKESESSPTFPMVTHGCVLDSNINSSMTVIAEDALVEVISCGDTNIKQYSSDFANRYNYAYNEDVSELGIDSVLQYVSLLADDSMAIVVWNGMSREALKVMDLLRENKILTYVYVYTFGKYIDNSLLKPSLERSIQNSRKSFSNESYKRFYDLAKKHLSSIGSLSKEDVQSVLTLNFNRHDPMEAYELILDLY